MTGRSIALFAAAALAEIGGAYLVWVGLRDDKGPLVAALGVIALGLYGVVATLQPENEFGRVLAAYGGVFIVGSIAWGVAFIVSALIGRPRLSVSTAGPQADLTAAGIPQKVSPLLQTPAAKRRPPTARPGRGRRPG